jgi:uncharacterized membrane protein YbhN (UPF0104 family)
VFSRRPPWAFLAGIVVTVGLLWWVLHDVDWTAVGAHMRRANLPLLFATVAVATATFLLRAFRWQVMLRATDGSRLSLLPLWRAVAVGFMANNLLPARAGEVARAWIAGRAAPVRVSAALASIVVERMFDALALVGLLAIALLAPSFPADAHVGGLGLRRLAFVTGAGFGAALLVCIFVVLRPEPWLGAMRALGERVLPARFAAKVTDIAEGVVQGLSFLRAPGRLPGVVVWSLVLWLVNAASFWLGFRALQLDLPFEAALLLQGLIAFGVAIPSSPGFFGVFEAVTVVALGFYGVPKEQAVSYAVVYHITTFIPITVLGLLALAQLRVRLSDLRTAPNPAQ